MEIVRQWYKYILIIFIFSGFHYPLSGQEYFQWESKTGEFATIGILLENEIIIKDEPIAPGDEIGVFTPDGLCVGGIVWDGINNQALTAWGNNIMTEEIDGLRENEEMYFRIWKRSTETEFEVIKWEYKEGDGLYQPHEIYVIESLHAYELVDIPVQFFPENEAIHTPITMDFDWQHDPKAASYTFQMSTDPGFSDFTINENNIPEASLLVEDLENDTQYYWRVGAVDYGGDTEWSEVWTFTTIVALPDAPALVSLENGALHVSIDTVLVWNEAERAETYDIQISKKSDFSNPTMSSGELNVLEFEVNGMENDAKYYWRVRAENIAGHGEWSEAWNFTTIVALPDAPALASIENGALHVAIDTMFTWTEAERAETYDIQISKQANFSNIVANGSELNVLEFAVNGLENDTKYYWRVRSENIAGYSEWSDVWSFTTIVALPDAPALASIENGALNIAIDTMFTWNEAERAETYDIQISKQANFSNSAASGSELSVLEFEVSGLENDTKYYWRVRSENIAGHSGWSEVWSFTTIVALPDAPALVSPENDGQHLPVNIVLDWNDAARAETYHVQLSKSADFSSTVLNSSEESAKEFSVNDLENDTKYYWRVRSHNIAGYSEWSEVWSFTTIVALPDAPVLASPENNAQHVPVNIVLDWNDAARAETYHVQLSKSADFSSTVLNSSEESAAEFSVNDLENDTKYYWRVRSHNIAGYGEWSEIWSFTTIVALPAAPVLSSPGNDVQHVSIDTVLVWNDAARAETYHVQLSKSADFSSTVFNSSEESAAEFSVSDLENDTKYYWRVRSHNIAGFSGWSEVWSFTTIVALPDSPLLATPVKDAENISIDTVLTWDEAERATTYDIQISKKSDFSNPATTGSNLDVLEYQVNGLENAMKYYWRVRSSNVAGKSEWSEVWSFTTIVAIPDIPVLASPENGVMHIAVNAELVWNETERAETYQVQISDEADWSHTIFDSSGIAATELIVNNLNNNGEYYWRVRAKNINGYSDWSETFSIDRSKVTTYTTTYRSGWNFVGLPLEVADADYKSLFPNAIEGTLFAFDGSFKPKTDLEVGVGYWLRLTEDGPVEITGAPMEELTIELTKGWNMISGISSEVPINSIDDPEGIMVPGAIFGFNGSYYTTDVLKPGMGYWVRVNDDGEITLSANENDQSGSLAAGNSAMNGTQAVPVMGSFDRIVIRNAAGDERTLYFGGEMPEGVQRESYSLPPVPPGDAFDARFSDDYFLSKDNEVTVQLMSNSYPVELTLYSSVPESETEYAMLQKLRDDNGTEHRVVHEERIVIYEDDAHTVQFRRIDAVDKPDIPKEYSLSQNFPNPFNSTTTIRYALPEDSHVTIEVYNMLGQRVRVLVNEDQPAGYYDLVFNAGSLASGTYIYRIVAGDFVRVKKLLHLK